MRIIIKKIVTKINTFFSLLGGVQHGKNTKCNFRCTFTDKTVIGNNCHFNGMKISGSGKVVIGDNFHSGKNIRVITTFHNYEHGTALPYDNSTYNKDVIIGENVWIGESVLILGGVCIGEGSVIQAGSVVCTNIPPLSVAGGHPAKTFKFRNEEHYYKLKNSKSFN